eukprot:SAG31_NODE_12122_length_966_cov_1.294118_1_plen_41_part_01
MASLDSAQITRHRASNAHEGRAASTNDIARSMNATTLRSQS